MQRLLKNFGLILLNPWIQASGPGLCSSMWLRSHVEEWGQQNSQSISKRPLQGYHIHWMIMLPTLTSHHSGNDIFGIYLEYTTSCFPSSTILPFATTDVVGDDALSAPTFLSKLDSFPTAWGSFSQIVACFPFFFIHRYNFYTKYSIPSQTILLGDFSFKMTTYRILALLFTLAGPWQVTAQREHQWSTFGEAETPTSGILR